MRIEYTSFLIGIIFMLSCGENFIPPSAPEITYLGLGKDTMLQGSVNQDSTLLVFEFYDADGDLGDVPNNIVVIDTRDGEIYNSYTFPPLPLKGGDAAQGEFSIVLPTVCCIFPDNIPPCESPPQYPTNDLIVEVFIVDSKGNESNRVQSGVITLLCN